MPPPPGGPRAPLGRRVCVAAADAAARECGAPSNPHGGKRGGDQTPPHLAPRHTPLPPHRFRASRCFGLLLLLRPP
jgi:hypothetical protein